MNLSQNKIGLITILSTLGFILLFLPYALYSSSFISRLARNEQKWDRADVSGYRIVVASNSLTDCTGGINRIIVASGEVVEAENSEHPYCDRSEFAQLTVEALFTRIWDQCVRKRSFRQPFPICSVSYDKDLGSPGRLDTFQFNDEGEYLPSITVMDIQIIE